MRWCMFIVYILVVFFLCLEHGIGEYSHKRAFLIDNNLNSVRGYGRNWLCYFLGVCALVPHTFGTFDKSVQFHTVHKWSQLEFDYPSAFERQNDINSKFFIPGVPAPIDVDIQYSGVNKNRIFVTIPRFQPGIPVALGVVTNKQLNGNPIIAPYPSWNWHRNPTQCHRDRIISVYRVQIDECGRLWVLDTGRFGEEQTCNPQILVFNLDTDRLIHRFEIPSTLLEPRSILVTPIVDIRDGRCDDAFVYIADCQTFSIIVYDLRRQTAWKATDKTMYPYPNFGTFDIAGDSFDLMDGVLGMTISPHIPGQDRKLFYHAMSSNTENYVWTSDLRNETRFKHNPGSSPEIFHTYEGVRKSQSAAEAIDNNGIMYFGDMSPITINCWNTNTEYGPDNIDTVASNPDTMQFASGVKVITNNDKIQELWVVTSRFQKIATGTLNTSEVNFRIQGGRIDDLVFPTLCRRQNSRPIGGSSGHVHTPQGHQHIHGGGGYKPNHNRLNSGYGFYEPENDDVLVQTQEFY